MVASIRRAHRALKVLVPMAVIAAMAPVVFLGAHAAEASIAPPATDKVVHAHQASPASILVAPGLTTAGGNELILAFVATDGPSPGVQVLASVSGAGLTWSRAVRANGQAGDSEVWQAWAPAQLTNAQVSATLAGGAYAGTIVVASFRNAAPVVAATAAASGASGAPAVVLKATAINSTVWAVGNDWDNAIGRSVATNQTLVDQFVNNNVGDTNWIQQAKAATVTAGTATMVSDTAPTSDRWNLAAVEVAPSATTSTTTTTRPVVPPTTTVPATTTTVKPPPPTTVAPATTTVPPATTTVPPTTSTTVARGSGGTKCGLTAAAFCETFDQPQTVAGSRSGQLSSVWGVSRISGLDNPPQGQFNTWADVNLGTTNDSTSGSTICGPITRVSPPNDVKICNGQVVEALNDNGGQAVLAMYPRQPFDFAGRTGTATFDVSDNSQGGHAAWPAFVISDQPLPAPYSHASFIDDHARNSLGFTLDGVCGPGVCTEAQGWTANGNNYPTGVNMNSPSFKCQTVGSFFKTENYQLVDIPFNVDGCVLPSKTLGSNNHFEVRISGSAIAVYGSDPDQPSTLRLIADAKVVAPLTRGLVWMEDVHYNGDKFNNQQSNSFSWDNVGFDGPVLARDLGFDVPDVTSSTAGPAVNGLPTVNLAYTIPYQGSQTFTVPNVTGVDKAAGALVVFNYIPNNPQAMLISVNGNPPLKFAWPNTTAYQTQTAGISVPLSQLHNGTNTLVFSDPDNTSSYGVDIANIDIIVAGGGGIVNP